MFFRRGMPSESQHSQYLLFGRVRSKSSSTCIRKTKYTICNHMHAIVLHSFCTETESCTFIYLMPCHTSIPILYKTSVLMERQRCKHAYAHIRIPSIDIALLQVQEIHFQEENVIHIIIQSKPQSCSHGQQHKNRFLGRLNQVFAIK